MLCQTTQPHEQVMRQSILDVIWGTSPTILVFNQFLQILFEATFGIHETAVIDNINTFKS